MISYVSLHQLGYGDIMLPQDAHCDGGGCAHAEFYAPQLLGRGAPNPEGRIYYDAVTCYNEYGQQVRIFATETRWIAEGDWITINAQNI